MKKSFLLLMVFIAIHSASVGQVKNSGFSISGTTSGYADSTRIYLDDLSGASPTHMDSTWIMHNRFRFAGSIDADAKQMLLRINNSSDYKFLWLENSPIVLNAAKGKLGDAVISGSKTQDEDDQLDASIKSTGKEMEQDTLFIRTHPNSVISVSILSVYCAAWGKAISTQLYMDLSEKNRFSADGLKVLEFIRLNRDVKTGGKYVDFEQPDTDGKMTRVSGIRARVILLEFWGSWCTPCREQNPELVRIYNEFKARGFEILGVAADDHKEEWLKAIHDDNLPWRNVSDLRGDRNRAVLIYGVSRFPSNFLIDHTGTIVAKDLQGDALRAKLAELLK